VEKVLGVLPVVAEYCRRLDLAGIVDRACPIRDVAILSHGQVIEALVANRLTSPSLLRVGRGVGGRGGVREVHRQDGDAHRSRPRPVEPASAYAAGSASTSVISTTSPPTQTVFHTKIGNAVSVKG
jgi:hypothetical protein